MTDASTTLRNIAAAFEWRHGRVADETWLAPGASIILESLTLFPTIPTEAYWACALLLCVMERGGSCLPIERLRLLPEYTRLPPALQELSTDQWRRILAAAAASDDVHPLVIAHNALYFDRLYRLELDVAERLVQPLGPHGLDRPANWTTVVNDLFGEDETSQQRHVASTIFDHRCSLLAGGPGSGKTFTVAKTILALYRATNAAATIRICAPTGKAAQRVREALMAVVNELDPSNASAIAETIQPTTIHTLLGISPLSHRRRQSEPLHVDFVICDETSMVDLMLLSELLRSLDSATRLLLVGDPNQLQSVDVGSVMTDLVAAMNDGLPGVTLTSMHRLSTGEGVDNTDRDSLLAFFEAIKNEDIESALQLLQTGSGGLRHVPLTESGSITQMDDDVFGPAIERATLLRRLAEGGTDDAITSALTETMVLTAQHHGQLSRTWWIEKIATATEIPLRATPSFPGTPVLITATDRSIGVTNGDVGLVTHRANNEAMFQPFVGAVNDDDEVKPKSIRPAAITSWQPWWAMTIHKSQGSEFNHVIVSITPRTRLLSRELLYTAVTRAKKSVTILGHLDDIRAGLESPAQRYSGLATAITQAAAASRA